MCFRLLCLVLFLQCNVYTETSYTTAGYGDAFTLIDSDEVNVTTESVETIEQNEEKGNLTLELRMATECETPNHDPGYCIEIKQCSILLKQITNIDAKSFIIASKCGPKNEDYENPKVCCGKFGSFRQTTAGLKVDDNTVLPKRCGHSKVVLMRSRILGGTKASLGEFPWMARLVHKNQHGFKSVGCSAFLVHTKYVVTAAHCAHKSFTKIRGPVFSVILGEHNTETKVDCNPKGTYCADPLQISRVAKVIVHPGYDVDSSGHYNDIAIIHMKKAARITDFVQPICLKINPVEDSPQTYTISGWGKTETEQFSKIKMKVELPSVKKSECTEKYNTINIELAGSQICAGGEDGKDSCNGDSGGPLMVENGTNFLAVGVVSYGIGCGIEGWPGVYTSIPSFVPWIKEQIIINSMVNSKGPKLAKHRKKKNTVKKTLPD